MASMILPKKPRTSGDLQHIMLKKVNLLFTTNGGWHCMIVFAVPPLFFNRHMARLEYRN